MRTLAPLNSGEDFAGYEVIRTIGRGGTGVVYRVRGRDRVNEFAMKVLSVEFSKDAEHRARFDREAAVLAEISHPNVLRLYDQGDEGGVLYAVSDLGWGSLRTYLDERDGRPLPLSDVVRVVELIGSALDAAHRHGIVHRDVKPENVIVLRADDLDSLRLGDFGICLLRDGARLTEDGHRLGTPVYMAPEHGKASDGFEKLDVFALGTVLHEILTGVAGCHPGCGASDSTDVRRRELHAIASTATARDRESRYASPGHVVAAVQEVGRREQPSLRPPPLTASQPAVALPAPAAAVHGGEPAAPQNPRGSLSWDVAPSIPPIAARRRPASRNLDVDARGSGRGHRRASKGAKRRAQALVVATAVLVAAGAALGVVVSRNGGAVPSTAAPSASATNATPPVAAPSPTNVASPPVSVSPSPSSSPSSALPEAAAPTAVAPSHPAATASAEVMLARVPDEFRGIWQGTVVDSETASGAGTVELVVTDGKVGESVGTYQVSYGPTTTCPSASDSGELVLLASVVGGPLSLQFVEQTDRSTCDATQAQGSLTAVAGGVDVDIVFTAGNYRRVGTGRLTRSG